MATTAEFDVHPQSKEGFSEGKAELYDKYRPSYPAEVLSTIRKAIGDKDQLNVVEFGSGTGILTRAMLAHPEWKDSIAQFRAVEPEKAMRDVFVKTIHDPRVSVEAGTFDQTTVPDAWADVIVIAQAFHWCTKHRETALEFARILKPGGLVAMMWNKEQNDEVPWQNQVFQIRKRYPSMSEEEVFAFLKFFETKEYLENFEKPGAPQKFNNDTTATLDSFTTYVMTWSVFARLPEEEKKGAEEEIREVLKRGDGMVWVDKERGVFEVRSDVDMGMFKRK